MDCRLKLVFAAACALLCGLCLADHARGQALPEGKGKAEFVHNCTACHRADMVVAVRKTPEEWKKTVIEMAARGTDGTKEDLENVTLYLSKYFSTESPSAEPATPASHPPPPDKPGVPRMMSVTGRHLLKCGPVANGCFASRCDGSQTHGTRGEVRQAAIETSAATGKISPTALYGGRSERNELNALVRFLAYSHPVS